MPFTFAAAAGILPPLPHCSPAAASPILPQQVAQLRLPRLWFAARRGPVEFREFLVDLGARPGGVRPVESGIRGARADLVVFTASDVHAWPSRTAPRVVLRSSWQTVNIGDIAHTPGMLALLEKYFPEAVITLWPSNVDNGVKEMLAARFPKLQFVGPKPDVAKLYAENDFLLHGSGPSLVGEKQVAMWRKQGPKPYGVLGITQGKPTPETIDILSGAQFVYFRDSVSLETAKAGDKIAVTWKDNKGDTRTDEATVS